MGTICPSCKSAIPVEDINVSTDLALCRACGKTYRFSEIVRDPLRAGADLANPPGGAWYEKRPNGFSVGATTRSWMALFLVPFTCAWSGGSLFGIYGRQIATGHFDFASSLFGLPFLAGSVFLLAGCLMTTAGKTVITRDSDRLTIFNGVGWLGLTRSYLWSDFRYVREDSVLGSFNVSSNFQGRTIALEGRRRITFGSAWTSQRRYFVLSALRSEMTSSSISQGMSWAATGFRQS
jgi:hypothetical protein